MHACILKITLFSELNKRYGKNITKEQTRAFLRQKAFVDIVKAQKIAPNVTKIYKKVSRHLLSAEELSQPPTSEVECEGRREDMQILDTKALKIEYKNVLIRIPRDDIEAIEFVEKALAFMKKELLEEKRQKATKTETG